VSKISSNNLRGKLKNGDLIYFKDYNEDFNGWCIVVGGGYSGINTVMKGAHCGDIDWCINEKHIEKVIFIEDLKNDRCRFGEFLHTFNEKYIEKYITEVVYKTEKETQLEDLIIKLSTQLNNAKIELDSIRGK
jgi:hypothetical protein